MRTSWKIIIAPFKRRVYHAPMVVEPQSTNLMDLSTSRLVLKSEMISKNKTREN
jgi:hypothetical protein